MSVVSASSKSNVSAAWRGLPSASPRFYPFYAAVVGIQGVHVVEHIIQLIQVYRFGIPSEKAFGLLGYVFNFQDTAEWMHFVFNLSYLITIYLLVVGARQLMLAGTVPKWAYQLFLFLGAGLETWHMIEHVVIMYHVIVNSGCPCPGIGDAALKVSDVQLHFVYNTITYVSVVLTLVYLHRSRRSSPGRRGR